MKVKIKRHLRKGKNKTSVVRTHARTKSQYGRGQHPNSVAKQAKPKKKIPVKKKVTLGSVIKNKLAKNRAKGIANHPKAKEAFAAGVDHLKNQVQKIQGAVQNAQSKVGL